MKNKYLIQNKFLKQYSTLILVFFLLLQISIVKADDKEKIELIDSLVNLPFSYNVLPPQQRKLIDQKSSNLRSCAASLIERKKLFIQRWQSAKEKDYLKNSFPTSLDKIEIVCLFPEKYLDSFIKQGQLNLHQVGHSRGLAEPRVRVSAEDYFIGIHLEEKHTFNPKAPIHCIRPKYAFLNFLDPTSIRINPLRLLPYGQIIIVYKDSVKQRCTYTFGDSLSSFCEPWAKTLHPLDPIPLTLLQAPKIEANTNTNFFDCRYVEAQIWGPLDLSDVKEFRIPENRIDLLTILDKTGLPVFSYDRQYMELTDTYVDVCKAGLGQGKALNNIAKNVQVQSNK